MSGESRAVVRFLVHMLELWMGGSLGDLQVEEFGGLRDEGWGEVRVCKEQSDELRKCANRISTYITDTSIRLATANLIAIANVMEKTLLLQLALLFAAAGRAEL